MIGTCRPSVSGCECIPFPRQPEQIISLRTENTYDHILYKHTCVYINTISIISTYSKGVSRVSKGIFEHSL